MMVKRKVDNRVRVLIENGIASGHRSFFVVVGKKSRDQVIYLHHILSKTFLKQANVLWCYKHKLEFSSHRRKRMKQLKAKQRYGNVDLNEDDPFEMFVSMTEIRYCYYKETHKILGNTFKMCVLQDFESLTPNILCRTIETVEGGGVIVILLESMTSLKQLYTLNMDVHSRYRTEAHQVVVPRFNERFILSLSTCPSCLVLDDELQILPISSLTKEIEPIPFSHTNKVFTKEEKLLKELKESSKEEKPLGVLIGLCRTFDQASVVKEFIESITSNTLSSTITLTAARGRGKSAAMGLSMAAAIYVGYSNMFVTSPSPENLNTFFEFLLKGLDALMYEKHIHYQTLTSTNPEHNKAVMRITVKKEHRQFVQYISPQECDVLDNAELLVIDEAAAIPLPQVQSLLGPYLVFLASTVSGYEGTGRSLSLKLIKELREKNNNNNINEDSEVSNPKRRKTERGSSTHRKLLELSLQEPIRYKPGDSVEKWLYSLLCLETPPVPIAGEIPQPNDCNLFYVNRDMLFSFHKMTEKFLNNVMSLLVASHYRNTPDDLQTLSDAPAHHLFVLLPPTDPDTITPKPLCVIQVAYEGKISKLTLESAASFSGKKPAGDLIPWTVNNFYDDEEFPKLSGARIVRIATHPDLQGKGYGSRALKLLEDYYTRSALSESNDNVVLTQDKATFSCIQDEEIENISEYLKDKKPTQPLLLSMSERDPEALHYLGACFGASFPLVRFWKKAGFCCVYLSQVKNSQTGEHSSLFLKVLNEDKDSRRSSWLGELCFEFKDVVTHLLQCTKSFRSFHTKFALSFISNRIYKRNQQDSSANHLKSVLSERDFREMDLYLRYEKEFPRIMHLFERIALLYFEDKLLIPKVKPLRQAILVGVGIQLKSPALVASELEIPPSHLMAELYATIGEFYLYFKDKYKEPKNGV